MSKLWLMVSRSLRQHALSTLVTVLSVALACGLLMAVFCVKAQTHEAFTGGNVGFDAVLGARGSQLQLVLNSVFHLETSPGNIPWKMYQDVKANPLVKLAVPYAVGDNYDGFRLVGTTSELFAKYEYSDGKTFKLQPSQPAGRFFDPQCEEAVVGSFAAQKSGLKIGSTFHPYHGTGHAEEHAEQYTVVGILEPTNTPSDHVIWIPIEGIFRMGGHVLRGAGHEYTAHAGQTIPDEDKEVSAVMLKLTDPMNGMALDEQINLKGHDATLAWPISRVMLDLFDKIGWVDRVLTLVAYLVIFVSAGSILASIYNTMNERRREFAILRALGARRATLFSAILCEAAAIAGLGSLCGFAVYAVILGVAAQVIRAQTGVVLDVLQFHPVLVLAPLGMTLLGALAGIVPAVKAYGTDVATHLVPQA